MTRIVRHITEPAIALYGGSYFNFRAPGKSRFTIRDVARGLPAALAASARVSIRSPNTVSLPATWCLLSTSMMR